MSQSSNVLTTIIAPLIGTILCNIMWFSPLHAVLESRRTTNLTINPIPFGITIMNCIGWVGYGLMKQDYFIFLSNCTGIVLGVYYCLSSIIVLNKRKGDGDEELCHTLELIVIFAFTFWIGVLFLLGLVFNNSVYDSTNASLVGIIGCLCGLAYYVSPLSTLADVIKTKNSVSLYRPVLFTNLCNAFMWVVYGFLGNHDPLVWGPNLIGFLLTLFQLSLSVYYKSTSIDINIKKDAHMKVMSSDNSSRSSSSSDSSSSDGNNNRKVTSNDNGYTSEEDDCI